MEKKGETVALSGGGLYLVADLLNEVEQVVREDLESHPRFPDLHNRLGLIRFRREDFEGAKASFDTALSINPSYFVARQNLAFCLYEMSLKEEALGLFREGLDSDQRHMALNGLGLLHLREGRLREAEEAFAEAVSVCPSNALHPHNAAMAFFLQGRVDEATQSLRNTEKLCPPYSEFFSESLVFDEGRLSEEAYREYIREQEINPYLSEVHDHLGHAHSASGMFAEAEREYRMSVRVMPSLANYYGNLALLYSAQDKEQEVLLYQLKAVDAEPTSVDARAALAFEYSARGLASEAVRQFEAAKALRPQYADIRYNLGLLYLELERSEEAMAEFRAALEINENYLFARNSLAFILFKRGLMDEALAEYEKVVASGVCSSDILVNMGAACIAKEETDRAIDYFKQAISLNPEYPSAYYQLGLAYQAKGQRQKATWAWKAYLQHAKEDSSVEQVRKAMEKEL
jgi:tetratricopeptide (TPR) repeat protein